MSFAKALYTRRRTGFILAPITLPPYGLSLNGCSPNHNRDKTFSPATTRFSVGCQHPLSLALVAAGNPASTKKFPSRPAHPHEL